MAEEQERYGTETPTPGRPVSGVRSTNVATLQYPVGATFVAARLDAPVSGSVSQAESRTLADHGRRRARTTYIGENGCGLVMKLALNIGLDVQTLAFSEGLLLAERGGVAARLAAEVMSRSPIALPILKARVPLLLDPRAQIWFATRWVHTDIRLVLEAAQTLNVPVHRRRSQTTCSPELRSWPKATAISRCSARSSHAAPRRPSWASTVQSPYRRKYDNDNS
jgi:hypothetical protein